MDINYFFIAGVALIINAAILYLIIGAATKASSRAKYEWAQLELLAKIARAQGVPEDEIKATFKSIG